MRRQWHANQQWLCDFKKYKYLGIGNQVVFSTVHLQPITKQTRSTPTALTIYTYLTYHQQPKLLIRVSKQTSFTTHESKDQSIILHL